MTISRDEAQIIVNALAIQVQQYQAVPLGLARACLGERDFDRMMQDAIRNKGPSVDTVYPWNMVDYLSGYRKPGEPKCESPSQQYIEPPMIWTVTRQH